MNEDDMDLAAVLGAAVESSRENLAEGLAVPEAIVGAGRCAGRGGRI
jgi:cobalamin biosynthesis protein CobD/CbiB